MLEKLEFIENVVTALELIAFVCDRSFFIENSNERCDF